MQYPTMTLDEFEAHLDTHGAVLDRWPTAAATRGADLLATAPAARVLYAHAQMLAKELDLVAPADPLTTGALRARILEEVTQTMQRRGIGWFADGWLRPAVLALIPLCLGFAIGVGYPERSGVNDDLIYDVSVFAFAVYEEYSDAQ